MRCEAVRSVSVGLVIALAAVLGPERPATACGPDFPTSLLGARSRVLAELPEGRFLVEVGELVTPRQRYPVVGDEPVEVDDVDTEERRRYLAGDYEGVLALPPAERRHRSTWASYMLGRTRGWPDGTGFYRQVRRLVDEGYADDAGLAASSLGQEARLYLEQGDRVTAVKLYAEQAALGHPSAAPSLLFVVRAAIADGAEAALIADPTGQAVIATYLATRRAELTDDEAARVWQGLLAARHLAAPERLAVIAYQEGQWDRATALVARAGASPLTSWVRAKLALRAGDRAGADRALAAAEAGYATRAVACDPDDGYDGCWDPQRSDRVRGERALVALADGRWADALDHLWGARGVYPSDVAYLAERVVTIDELARFVRALDAGAPAEPEPWTMDADVLAAILGRRMMRAGRYAEALAYLPASARAPAMAYAAARTAATQTDDPIAQAEHLYTASLFARQDGLEILGTASAPDWAMYEAQYDPDARWDWIEDTDPDPDVDNGHEVTRVERLGPGSPLEVRRFLASQPASPRRYHYRHLAADLAEAAADRLPHRSQAYAMALCQAATYVHTTDAEREQGLWRRYVRTGPAAVSMDFGIDCPAPDFARARRYLPRHHTPWPAVVGGAIGGLGLIALAVALWRRRQRRFAARP